MAWRPSFSDDPYGKTYFASDFRSYIPSSVAFTGEVRRHKFDCELAAAAAAYSRGPTYSGSTVDQYARNLSSRDNFHYYGSAASNIGHDRSSVNQVLQSRYYDKPVVLNSHEASHIRAGADWLAAHKDEFSNGFIKSASSLYENVYDQDGHKVVDRRAFR
ncbi:unnamed protein product [Rotaria sp. Silwood2]|nr:unnamed protein product [Rotaria sp. Silwood2]CAF4661726.1 unnamed protein product [Rotaria sp. Silwood2]